MLSTALQFSGGKDSLATLHLWDAMHGLDSTLVMWVNTGQAYDEVIEVMRKTKARVPHFLEIKSDVTASIKRHGYPSDIVPIINTSIGLATNPTFRGPMIQSWASCCGENIWAPLHQAVMDRGIKCVVRGQRTDELMTSPIQSGFVDQFGIEYIMPLETWSAAEVFQYLRENNIDSPEYYAKGETTSRDCWSCTAYMHHGSIDRINDLPLAKRRVVKSRLQEIRVAVEREHKGISEAIGHGC